MHFCNFRSLLSPAFKFGNAFLQKFSSTVLSPSSEAGGGILQDVTLIDTPGILSGEKQRVCRGYDFAEVLQWFAERVDLIVLLFDANKLDISDELKGVIEALKPNTGKMRIVLNKADMVTSQELMRVYGSLMWSLGNVYRSPEVRIIIFFLS